jgi:hypothetical protein
MDWGHALLLAAAGGGVLFVWNMICWVALPHHMPDFRRMTDASGVEAGLLAAGATPGFYQLPHVHDFPQGFKDPGLVERYARGPNALIVVSPAGKCMDGSLFVMGLVLYLLQAFAGAVILHMASEHVVGLARTTLFFGGLGALVFGTGHATQSVWLHFPWSHSIKCTLDGTIGWALMGLVFHLIG